jgi:uncharacterized Zn finger protein (UPF0148 family)
MKCPNCNEEVTPTTRFCPKCGEKVIVSENEVKQSSQLNQPNQSIREYTNTSPHQTTAPYYAVQQLEKACPQCGLNIFQYYDFCPRCGYHFFQKPQNLKFTDNSNSKVKKKDSTLSIIAAVFALFTITSLVGLIIGLIDIGINDKSKKHLGSWFAIIYGIICGLATISML